ncbi:4Fe-4S binding protein [candidate division KSB1 bacterium]|nr:4Fe-4S binding protein [candidate division KSB1 bacterium]
MSKNIYEKLALYLDNLPSGFPRSENGVEMRILKRLYTPEEAGLAVHLSLIEENARVVARRAKLPLEKTRQILRNMEKKGLVFVFHKDEEEPMYQAVGYVIGIYEFQLNRLDADNVKDFEEYLTTYFDPEIWKKTPQLRTIPVGESINVRRDVMVYERAEEIVRSKKKIAVAPCICRREKKLLGEGCGRLEEGCLVFENAAAYYIYNGMAREIDCAEALDILRQANESGLVLQPGNSANPSSICTCCGCCCGVLLSFKRHPEPASIVASPYCVSLDPHACTGCGICESRCQMDAIQVDGAVALIDGKRCIGCGLCVSTCPSDALRLQRKPVSGQPHVPKNNADAYIRLGRARGKLSYRELAGMLVKSKIDRLLTKTGAD